MTLCHTIGMVRKDTITITDGDITFELPKGLSLWERSGSARCDECGRWTDAGQLLRHAKRCDNSALQPFPISDVGAVVKFAGGPGLPRVFGPVGYVILGPLLVSGNFVTVTRLGEPWTERRQKLVYGYLATDERIARLWKQVREGTLGPEFSVEDAYREGVPSKYLINLD